MGAGLDLVLLGVVVLEEEAALLLEGTVLAVLETAGESSRGQRVLSSREEAEVAAAAPHVGEEV